MRGRKFNFSEEEFLEAIKTSSSQFEALLKLGYSTNSSLNNSTRYSILFKKLNPDVSHFNFKSVSQIRNRGNGGSIQAYYNNYVRDAGYRNKEWDLTLEEFEDLVNGICYYCGKNGTTVIGNARKTNNLRYCGIDRKDNNLGYIKGNCVSCCKTCNWMKRDIHTKDFIENCKLIYLNHKNDN